MSDLRTVLQDAASMLIAGHAAEDADDGRLQAELLYGKASGLDRAQVIAAGADAPAPAHLEAFRALLERRADHEPLAYILGRREFYGRTFLVGPGCLVPRPETEESVEAALAAVREHPQAQRLVRVADIGTGSGAIGLSIAAHAPNTKVWCTDVSSEALQWAGKNMRRFGLEDRVVLQTGDLLEAIDEPIDVLCANLPYVPTLDYEGLPPQIRDREPRIAVEGGTTGIEIIERLCDQMDAHLSEHAAVILEVGAGQMAWVEDLVVTALTDAGRPVTKTEQHRDLRGIRRCLEVRTGF
ncbi:MAG: peptide chain release factor N(5)-glutamine methyltransferase [Dehalococcoidia bacterium]|nr:peptide chain release factor N(5)-glutamine methyltransferase [Dehalococcoidia bacterium]